MGFLRMQIQPIFNTDETGCLTDPNKQRLFFKKSYKDSYLLITTCGKSMYTTLVCRSASGEYLPLPPFVVYKGLKLYGACCQNGPKGAGYSNSQSGCNTDTIFKNWSKESFVTHVADAKKPVILLLDGHGSRLTYNIVKVASQLAPVMLSSLDVGGFVCLKGNWW